MSVIINIHARLERSYQMYSNNDLPVSRSMDKETENVKDRLMIKVKDYINVNNTMK